MDCDAIAPHYRWIEYGAFGKALERRRREFLHELGESKRALVLGDGHGRFTSELLNDNAGVTVDYVEASGKMIAMARQRTTNQSRIRFFQADALAFAFPRKDYDLFVTHFFLDCFSNAEVTALADRIRRCAAPGARWIISDFHQPASGWRKFHARVWLKAMYLFFGLSTGLTVRRLPDHRTPILREGFVLQRRVSERSGFIFSELWNFKPGAGGD